jgi:hypothetical protein
VCSVCAPLRSMPEHKVKTGYSQSPERGAGKRNVLCFQFTVVFPSWTSIRLLAAWPDRETISKIGAARSVIRVPPRSIDHHDVGNTEGLGMINALGSADSHSCVADPCAAVLDAYRGILPSNEAPVRRRSLQMQLVSRRHPGGRDARLTVTGLFGWNALMTCVRVQCPDSAFPVKLSASEVFPGGTSTA